MSTSDLTLDTSKFKAKNIPANTQAVNAYILNASTSEPGEPKWWEIGAQAYRDLQDEGKTGWPAPKFRSANGTEIEIPSRESGRSIKCRIVVPEDKKLDGVFYYIHGGGHVLAHYDRFDDTLDVMAKATGLAVISVEYRLAPEHPFPAGPEDVYDVAEYLVDNAPREYGGPLKFVGGKSAGSNLSILTVLHLLEHRPDFALSGAVLIYGLYDWLLLPSARTWMTPIILTTENIEHFGDAYLGDRTPEDRRDPSISPIYHPVFQIPGSRFGETKKEVKLPPALFLCGTQDALVDDTVLMSFRWQVAGGEATVKFVEGAPHGFLLFGADKCEMAARGHAILTEWLKEKVYAT
ncbi:related to lipase 2 [Phialocephala subalpina]|uniref:Related to lipase 2 n=1 Tax=Phialocephala subalpina TaxID=576137 RepID=A0A1L7XWU7_9HELO|nr:related to lipase 2 [Phialocephala subalpina]